MANEMKLKSEFNDAQIISLASGIEKIILDARKQSADLLSSVIVKTYWAVGQYIVNFEQNGNAKSKYGTTLLTKLAKTLTAKLGRGFSRPNLNNMRKFYLLYPNLSDMSSKLTWSHICELIKIDGAFERKFYEKECVAGNWNVRALARQMDSALYLRIASSKDKQGILKLANNGMEIQTPLCGFGFLS